MTTHRHDTAPLPDSDEAFVREVLDSAMSGTRPRVDLPSAALAHGRRLRTRRRVAVGAVAVAASVLAVATAPYVLGGGSASTGGSTIATQPPAPEPAVVQGPAGWWDMPATDMVDAVRAILPDGVTVTDPGPLVADTPEGGPAHGWIAPQLDAPSGPGSLNVILYPGEIFPLTCKDCADPDEGVLTGEEALAYVRERAGTVSDVDVSCGGVRTSDRARCDELLDAQGHVVGRRLTERWRDGVTINEVVLRRDGGTVYVASSNTLDAKWSEDSPVSADRPPLTLDDLENLVRNDVWVSFKP